MDDKTAKALEKSIAHWRENESVTRKDDACVTCDGCALCDMFSGEENEHMGYCAGCPVSSHTGMSDCEGTPWRQAYLKRFADRFTLDDFREAAKKEREFLESLREPAPPVQSVSADGARAAHRAFVDAGYASLDLYVERYGKDGE